MKDQIVGAWRLIASTTRREEDKVEIEGYWGENFDGLLCYLPNGSMSVQIRKLDRPHFSSEDYRACTPEEAKSALTQYAAYYGTFEVDEAEQKITHHLEGNLFPNWENAKLVRTYEFKGDTITLATAPELWNGKICTGRLTWKKVP